MASTIPGSAAVEISDLVKRYPKAAANAVDSISFTVPHGELFGLLGPNGAGKTTTIGILTTMVAPTGGSARIMNSDVTGDPMRIKQQIAVVPQRSNLDVSLRVRDILTFHAHYHGVPRVERNARADALLSEFGLAQRGNEKIGRYSGGMTQRVMLARALMHMPDVLFLDEPTNNLDPQARLFLWDRIRALHKQGVTILLTTHDMEEADQLCERIAIMDHGRVLVLDTPSELKKLIPGGTTLELRIRVPEHAVAQSTHTDRQFSEPHVQTTLAALPGVTKVDVVSAASNEENLAGIQVYRLYAENANALVVDAVRVIAECGVELRDLHLARPSLEDVFIYLTGRNLRV